MKMLCMRCEHRAKFFETESGPRYECGNLKGSVYSCYMFTPVIPPILERNKDDDRDMDLPDMLAPRSHIAEEESEGYFELGGYFLSTTKLIKYWKLRREPSSRLL
jgi:hypothetical protein